MFSSLPGHSEKYFASNITPEHLKSFARRGHDRYLVLRQSAPRALALAHVGISASWSAVLSHESAVSRLKDESLEAVRGSNFEL